MSDLIQEISDYGIDQKVIEEEEADQERVISGGIEDLN